VFHPIVFTVILLRMPHAALGWQLLLGVVATVLVSLASFYGFERPCLRIKDRLAPERAALPKQAVLT
jgi:peptidoglycan/LPS O-acetylase OafA/YrhL